MTPWDEEKAAYRKELWSDVKRSLRNGWDRDLRDKSRALHILAIIVNAFGHGFVDFDLSKDEQRSVKSLQKARRYHLVWAILNMAVCVSNGGVSSSGWWTRIIVVWFGWEAVKRTMKALSAHKQIPMQTVLEVHDS